MPETTVDKDHCFMLGKDYVWFAEEVFAVQPEAVSHRVQQRPDANFWFGVLASYRRHVATSLFPCVDVNHQVSPAKACFSRMMSMNLVRSRSHVFCSLLYVSCKPRGITSCR